MGQADGPCWYANLFYFNRWQFIIAASVILTALWIATAAWQRRRR